MNSSCIITIPPLVHLVNMVFVGLSLSRFVPPPIFILGKNFLAVFGPGGCHTGDVFFVSKSATVLREISEFENRVSNPIYIIVRGRGVHQSKAPRTHATAIYLLHARRLLCDTAAPQ